jgi:DNA-binding NtrC family response regulator
VVPATNGQAAPELEFIFRTLYDLRLNLEDLRRDFEEYRERQGREVMPVSYGYAALGPPPAPEPEPEVERGVVVFRPGMTMSDLEREAINAALREARGNRRRAAEMLGIGERTMYRKLKEYAIEA